MLRYLYILLFILFTNTVYSQQITPNLKPYSKERMLTAIASYKAMQNTGNWNAFPEDLYLRLGDSNSHVTALQENLILTGDLSIDSAQALGKYTTAVKKAVSNFQMRHGLIPDGVVGPNTIAAINIPLKQRVWQLEYNLSHWDSAFYLSKQPYIVINLPDYTLQVVDNNKTALSMRVIIGEKELKTYPIISALDMVVLYPYWYIPKSIAVTEIVPLLRKNPGYLHKKGMILEKQTTNGWVKVRPWRINWHSIDASNYPYRMVQLNSDENELGQVKFLYPNKIPQYLHDTPRKELFAYPKRTFSHGCIRLEKPIELADFILERGAGYTPEKIKSLWDLNKPNHYLRIKDPLPLNIIYLTAWVDELLQVHFREDMYEFQMIPQISVR